MMLRSLISFVSLTFFSVVLSAQANAAQEQSVVLISLDGFRWDYIEKHQAKNLALIAKQGVRAQKLIPVYPTKTFPNHLSIMTGLLPTHHGVVDNKFCDKQRQECYAMGDGRKDSSWLNGVPLWNLATLQGVKSATYFWPESDALFNGVLPDYYYHYSKHSDYQARIDQMLFWLKLPHAQRPRFIAGYFSLVDSMGHDFGPDAPQTYEAVQKLDSLIGQLVTRIKSEVDAPVNVILVSDHGMASVDPTQSIAIADLGISQEDFDIKNSGTRVQLYQKQGRKLDLSTFKSSLSKQAKGRFTVLTSAQLASVGYQHSPRVADVIIETTAPRVFSSSGEVDYLGTHGYAYTQDMAAFFVANGPAFKQGFSLDEVKNLDIYPIVAQILGLSLLSPIDSEGDTLRPALKPAVN